ncbi:hypothetical protein HK104_011455, partial [Borealophlyctis nickersoniae]
MCTCKRLDPKDIVDGGWDYFYTKHGSENIKYDSDTPAKITVADVGLPGNTYVVSVDGTEIGRTPAVAAGTARCWPWPTSATCANNGLFSRATFELPAGAHTVTIAQDKRSPDNAWGIGIYHIEKLGKCSGNGFTVTSLVAPVPFSQASAQCGKGKKLAQLDPANVRQAEDIVDSCFGKRGTAWIYSWNGVIYDGTARDVCLAITS